LLGGLQERKTEDCRKKNREGGEEENRGEKPRAERDGEKKKQRRELEQKKRGGGTGQSEQKEGNRELNPVFV